MFIWIFLGKEAIGFIKLKGCVTLKRLRTTAIDNQNTRTQTQIHNTWGDRKYHTHNFLTWGPCKNTYSSQIQYTNWFILIFLIYWTALLQCLHEWEWEKPSESSYTRYSLLQGLWSSGINIATVPSGLVPILFLLLPLTPRTPESLEENSAIVYLPVYLPVYLSV